MRSARVEERLPEAQDGLGPLGQAHTLETVLDAYDASAWTTPLAPRLQLGLLRSPPHLPN